MNEIVADAVVDDRDECPVSHVLQLSAALLALRAGVKRMQARVCLCVSWRILVCRSHNTKSERCMYVFSVISELKSDTR